MFLIKKNPTWSPLSVFLSPMWFLERLSAIPVSFSSTAFLSIYPLPDIKRCQGLEGGGPDPAFSLFFHENPASCTSHFFSSLSRISVFLSQKYIKKD